MIMMNNMAITVPKHEMAISRFVDEGVITTQQYDHILGTHGETIRCDPALTGLDLICSSMDGLLQDSTIDRARITHIVICYDEVLLPCTYNLNWLFRDHYQLNKVEVCSLRDLYCSTSLGGLKLCKNLLNAGGNGDQIIMIIAERGYSLKERFDEHFVTGDSAVAILLSAAGQGDRILEVRHETTTMTDKPYGNYFTPIHLTKLLHSTTQAAGIPMNALKKIITSNIKSGVWSAVARTAKLPIERFLTEATDDYGPLDMTDGFINYDTFTREGCIKKGDYFALLTLGLYGGIGCAVCRRN
ncbi:hypothetical protein [Paenibacillus sp. SYP-B4298]|uniref:hypothetical protein n=1 Tax=Paenibacillus sp. SYP-B4298 TaxID=2996034 RepID=UPI0022DD6C01|nr:hypothetical protein [Paenibacillus sp. SYP-B4298]